MLRIEPVTDQNRDAALALAVRPEQRRFVASVEQSLRDAASVPDGVAWPRLIYDGDTLVGFVMGGFMDGDELFDSGVWRLLIHAEHQRKGYGRFAVEQVMAEARRRGRTHLGVFFTPGPDGPEGFWRGLGFQPNGKGDNEIGAEIALDDAAPM